MPPKKNSTAIGLRRFAEISAVNPTVSSFKLCNEGPKNGAIIVFESKEET